MKKINGFNDFSPIAKVCKRFERIAYEMFHLKIRKITVQFSKKTFGDKITLQQIEEFLNDFGSSIDALVLDEHHLKSINITDASNIFFKMINKYCKNLEELT